MKNNWLIKKLDDVCNVEYGTRVVKKRDGGGNYPVYGGGGATFFMNKHNRENCMVIARFAMSEKCTRFVEGKFFLNDSGLTVSPVDKKEIMQEFLDYQIIHMNDLIYSLARGSAQKNLDLPAFRKIDVVYPKSLVEQQRIVKILDEVFDGIEKVKKKAEKNLQNAKELFESYLKNVFVRFGGDRNSLGFEDCIDKIIYTNKIQRNVFLKSGKYPIVSQEKDIVNGFWNKKEDLFQIKKPIIAFGDHTQIIKYIDFDFVLGADGVKILQPKNFLDSKYFYYFLQSVDLKNLGYARHYRLLKEVEVVYPESLSEQKSIVAKLDALSAETKKLEEIYKKKISDLAELKKSVLRSAFAGEL